MATRSDLLNALSVEFTGRASIKRAEVLEFIEKNSEQNFPNPACFTNDANFRVQHGYFKVPNAFDVIAAQAEDAKKSPRGRKPGVKVGPYGPRKANKPMPMITEDVINRTRAANPRTASGKFKSRAIVIEELQAQGYLWG